MSIITGSPKLQEDEGLVREEDFESAELVLSTDRGTYTTNLSSQEFILGNQ